MSFSANVTATGATRNIDGLNAKQAILTLTMTSTATDGSNAKAGMAVTSEMWLVDEVPGMAELRAFDERMASEMAGAEAEDQISGMLKTQPGGSDALAQLKKESAKMTGTPVLSITRFGVSADGKPLPAPSAAPLAQSKDGQSTAGQIGTEVASQTATDEATSQLGKLSGLSRSLGNSSLGALMRHKPSSTAKPATTGAADNTANAGSAGSASGGVLLEAQTQMSNFSTAPVDLSSFAIPAGYTQVMLPAQSMGAGK